MAPPPPTPQVPPITSSGSLAEFLSPTSPLDSLPFPTEAPPVLPTATIPGNTVGAPAPHPYPPPSRPTSPSHPLAMKKSEDKRGVPRHGVGRPHNSGHRPHLTSTEAAVVPTTTAADADTRVGGVRETGAGFNPCRSQPRHRRLRWLADSVNRHGSDWDEARAKGGDKLRGGLLADPHRPRRRWGARKGERVEQVQTRWQRHQGEKGVSGEAEGAIRNWHAGGGGGAHHGVQREGGAQRVQREMDAQWR